MYKFFVFLFFSFVMSFVIHAVEVTNELGHAYILVDKIKYNNFDNLKSDSFENKIKSVFELKKTPCFLVLDNDNLIDFKQISSTVIDTNDFIQTFQKKSQFVPIVSLSPGEWKKNDIDASILPTDINFILNSDSRVIAKVNSINNDISKYIYVFETTISKFLDNKEITNQIGTNIRFAHSIELTEDVIIVNKNLSNYEYNFISNVNSTFKIVKTSNYFDLNFDVEQIDFRNLNVYFNGNLFGKIIKVGADNITIKINQELCEKNEYVILPKGQQISFMSWEDVQKKLNSESNESKKRVIAERYKENFNDNIIQYLKENAPKIFVMNDVGKNIFITSASFDKSNLDINIPSVGVLSYQEFDVSRYITDMSTKKFSVTYQLNDSCDSCRTKYPIKKVEDMYDVFSRKNFELSLKDIPYPNPPNPKVVLKNIPRDVFVLYNDTKLSSLEFDIPTHSTNIFLKFCKNGYEDYDKQYILQDIHLGSIKEIDCAEIVLTKKEIPETKEIIDVDSPQDELEEPQPPENIWTYHDRNQIKRYCINIATRPQAVPKNIKNIKDYLEEHKRNITKEVFEDFLMKDLLLEDNRFDNATITDIVNKVFDSDEK